GGLRLFEECLSLATRKGGCENLPESFQRVMATVGNVLDTTTPHELLPAVALLQQFRDWARALKKNLERRPMDDFMEALAPRTRCKNSLGLTAEEIAFLFPGLEEANGTIDPLIN